MNLDLNSIKMKLRGAEDEKTKERNIPGRKKQRHNLFLFNFLSAFLHHSKDIFNR
jgi:hypothetical protein